MNKSFRRLQSAKKPVSKIVLFCVWIIKRMTAVLKEVGTKERSKERSTFAIKVTIVSELCKPQASCFNVNESANGGTQSSCDNVTLRERTDD